MTPDIFNNQIKRLKHRFGDKAFDPAFVELLGKEISSMATEPFVKMIDIMIGQRPHNRPPTMTDFREMRCQAEKNELSRDARGAFNAVAKHLPPLKEMLERNFPGCESVKDAFEAERKRRAGKE